MLLSWRVGTVSKGPFAEDHGANRVDSWCSLPTAPVSHRPHDLLLPARRLLLYCVYGLVYPDGFRNEERGTGKRMRCDQSDVRVDHLILPRCSWQFRAWVGVLVSLIGPWQKVNQAAKRSCPGWKLQVVIGFPGQIHCQQFLRGSFFSF